MLKARQTLGKYRIDRKIADGGFAAVYKAYDTIEGIPVALKVPHQRHVTKDAMEDFRKEARLVAKLDHPNILPIKNASFIDKLLVIVYPLGGETLDDRLSRRMSFKKAIDLADQMLEAVAYAHDQRVIHCDLKPANFIMFPDNRLRLADFGLSKIVLATRTIHGSGAGTVGYLAPEQAMGRPSYRSDVFSLGLILWEMFAGKLPSWPFDWPPPGYTRVRYALHKDFIALLRKSMQIDAKKRYEDAIQMQAAWERVRPKALSHATRRRRRSAAKSTSRDWESVRMGEFKRRFGKKLAIRAECKRCSGPLAETMIHCPWCGYKRKQYDGPTKFPKRCRRCKRGMKSDWRFCAWCFGPAEKKYDETREYTDVRYDAKCSNKRCKRKVLMPYMRYCPWCRTKVRRKWKVPGADDKCGRCGWGVAGEFWGWCPWCGRRQE